VAGGQLVSEFPAALAPGWFAGPAVTPWRRRSPATRTDTGTGPGRPGSRVALNTEGSRTFGRASPVWSSRNARMADSYRTGGGRGSRRGVWGNVRAV